MSGDADVVVVGAGLGGLGAALHLAESGARVVVLEALTYPGGCAATFTRHGRRHDAGATLLAGLEEGGFLRRWLARHGVALPVQPLDPVVRLRAPRLALDVPAERERLAARLRALPGAPQEALARFLSLQARVADALWDVLADPRRLPPAWGALGAHLRRRPGLLRLLPLAARPLGAVVRGLGLGGWEPLRVYLDAVCQITLQCRADEAEAPLALGVLDYWFRGAAHLAGGAGTLAHGFASALERAGGRIRYATRAQRLARVGGAWTVACRGGDVRAPALVLNLLPRAVERLLPPVARPLPRLARQARAVDAGWGAAMLYLTLDAPVGEAPDAQHLQLIDDDTAPFTEGNHVFVAVGDAGEGDSATDGSSQGVRRATVSTHVPLARLRALGPVERGAYVAEVQARMRRTLARRAPAWAQGVRAELTASPRTFERFTGRPEGAVGGAPRRAGWGAYRDLVPRPLLPGLWLVGDTQFPGQSTLAAALGGWAVAERLLQRAPRLRR